MPSYGAAIFMSEAPLRGHTPDTALTKAQARYHLFTNVC
jgi:hypothetical protein